MLKVVLRTLYFNNKNNINKYAEPCRKVDQRGMRPGRKYHKDAKKFVKNIYTRLKSRWWEVKLYTCPGHRTIAVLLYTSRMLRIPC